MNPPEKAALTPAQAAHLLGVGVDAVTRYFDEGQLEGFRLPSGHRRIYAESVDEMRGKSNG